MTPLTARARLTAVYGTALALAGLAMLGASYAVLHARLTASPGADRLVVRIEGPPGLPAGSDGSPVPLRTPLLSPQEIRTADGGTLADQLEAYQRRVREEAERTLLVQSGVALAVLVGLAVVSGYLLAGRVLRPVHEVSALARDIEAHDLHRRIPRRERGRDGDELAELVDVVNGMLDRLERGFEAQRRFLVNAGHELRTPLAVQRTVLEVAAGGGSGDAVKGLAATLLPMLDRQQRAVDGLLAIARARAGDAAPLEVDVASIVSDELDALAGDIGRRGVVLARRLEAGAVARADRDLLELVVGNLLSNAVRHAPRGGRVEVTVLRDGDEVRLAIDNEGEPLDPDRIEGLAEPFRRGGTPRVGADEDGRQAGAGLGLVIARDAAEAAGASLVLRPRPGGGVAALLTLPGGQA